MDTAPVRTVAGRRPECVAAHVSECDPLAQIEELDVDREGRVFDRRAYLDGLACPAVCLPVRDFELGRVRKYASRRSENRRSTASGLTGRQNSPQGRSAYAHLQVAAPTVRQQTKADAVMQGSGPEEDDLFGLIQYFDLVSHLHCDEFAVVHSFVVVNTDTNLIFKDVSDLKELTCSSCLLLQCTLVNCDRGVSTMEARQHRQPVWSKVAYPCTHGRCSLLRSWRCLAETCEPTLRHWNSMSLARSRVQVDHSAQWRSGPQPPALGKMRCKICARILHRFTEHIQGGGEPFATVN